MIERVEYRGALDEESALAASLRRAGLTPPAADRRARLFAQAFRALIATQAAPHLQHPLALFVPGRIEVLGKHTDYAGGRSMVVATEQGFSVVAAPRSDKQLLVLDAVRRESAQFALGPDLVPVLGHWSNYPMTVVRRVARNFPSGLEGATVAFASDLPLAAGMSSSSALVVAVFLVLAAINRLDQRTEFCAAIRSRTDLAHYLGCIENGQTFGSLEGDRGVGTFGGSEDHTAMLCARPGHLTQFAYCPTRLERVIPLPSGYVWAVGVSGVVAEKTGSARDKYNAASRRASELARLWREATGEDSPHLAAILASRSQAASHLADLLATSHPPHPDLQALLDRLNHFALENEQIIPEAGEALAAGDLEAFGVWVDRSQQAAERLLGNQIPETSDLARLARSCGALAASAFGAGFGGSVWAMIPAESATGFLAAWADAYRTQYPHRAPNARFFVTTASLPAFQLAR